MSNDSCENKLALRYDQNKDRYDLITTKAYKDLAKVFTRGAEKYEPRNWEKGMSWSRCLASLKRHLQAFEECKDYDDESKLLHITHVVWNAFALNEYYYSHPELDDRNHPYLNIPRIGLDIDGVLSDMGGDIAKIGNFNENELFHWSSPLFTNIYNQVKEDADFWENLTVKEGPDKILFEPICYISHVNNKFHESRQKWLNKNNYPECNLHLVNSSKEKLEIAKKENLDIFVDDKFETFVEFNKSGIFCFLMDAPHNRKYNVGYKRIYSLSELPTKLNFG